MNMKNVAEIIGIMLGDGSIYLKKRIYQARIGGHIENDKEYLLNYVKPLLEKTFNTRVRIKIHPTAKELFLCIDRKDTVLKLIELGLKPGNKKKNNVGIPDWVFTDKELIKSCIRGLVDTDGCVYPKTLKHPSASIWFTTTIPKLQEDFSNAIRLLGFHLSKWVDRTNMWGENRKDTCIGRRDEALKYFREIGFSNKYHEIRFLKYLRKPPSSSPVKDASFRSLSSASRA